MRRLVAPLRRAGRVRQEPADGARPTAARRLGAALALGVLSLVGGLVFAESRPSAVIAETKVLLAPLAGNAFSTRVGNTLVDLETEAELPRSDVVVAEAAKAVGAPSPGAVRSRLVVRLAPGTEVMVVAYRAPTAERAVSVAVAVAEATLAERTAQARASLAAREAWLGTAIGSAEEQITAASIAGDEVGVAVLTRRLALLRSQLAGLSLESADAGEVLGTATHRDQTGALMGRGLALGGLGAGALVGLFIVDRASRWRHRWRMRFRRLPLAGARS